LEFKPNYVTREVVKDRVTFFFSELYFPKTFADLKRKVNPKKGHLKKRDSQDHVALLAMEDLYKKEYFNEFLLPNMQHPVLATLHP
jgi:hypothetical protein